MVRAVNGNNNKGEGFNFTREALLTVVHGRVDLLVESPEVFKGVQSDCPSTNWEPFLEKALKKDRAPLKRL